MPSSATPIELSLTDTLCTHCGLCCDGSLFAEVELAGRAEETRMEVLGLVVEEDDAKGAQLQQPCAALLGTRCSIYAHRPACCRTFECRLLQEVRRGTVSVERAGVKIAEALTWIGRVRALMSDLGNRNRRLPLRESVADALAVDRTGDAHRSRKRTELEATMAIVEELIQVTFLDPPRSRHHATRADESS